MQVKELVEHYINGGTSGQSYSGRIVTEGDITYFYSYSTVIAKLNRKENRLEINRTKYSTTTSRQQNYLIKLAKNTNYNVEYYEA